MSEQKDETGKKALLGGLGVLGIALFKFKTAILIALKGLSFLKFAWLLKSLASIFVAIGVYWAFFGPIFALVVVGVIIIHEMGHFIFMQAMGLKPQLGMIIPFVGASTRVTLLPKDQKSIAWYSIGGPLVGGVTSIAFFYMGVVWQMPLLMAAGHFGCFLNLIQLIPVRPFDGGAVLGAISPWLMVPGLGILFAMAAYLHSAFLIIIGIIATFITVSQLISHMKNKEKRQESDAERLMRGICGGAGRKETKDEPAGSAPAGPGIVHEAGYGDIREATTGEKVLIGLAYFVLTGVLGYMYWLTDNETISFLRSR